MAQPLISFIMRSGFVWVVILCVCFAQDDLMIEDECLDDSMADLAAAMEDSNLDTEQVEMEQDDVAFEDITGNLTVVSPSNGSEFNGTSIAVHLNVNTNCPNVTRFQEKFNKSNICISMDDSIFSCWPIFTLSRYPVFNNLESGNHSLVAKLVDPLTGDELLDESVATSTFFLHPKNATESEISQDDVEEEEEDDDDDVEDTEKKPKKETISVPQVGIEYPSENIAVSPTFEARLHIVTSANLTKFRRLFQESFLCISLDPHNVQSCWPIFEDRYYPKFFHIPQGHHSMIASISHPNTLETIPGTSLGVRSFWVHEKGSGMIPMKLDNPTPGSNAFPPELQAQVLDELNVVVLDEDLDEDTKESISTSKDIPFIILQVNINGERVTLKVFEDEKPIEKAARFCVENDIMGQNCVSSLKRLIEIEWQRYHDIPHIELFT